jgi:hypothetical protein
MQRVQVQVRGLAEPIRQGNPNAVALAKTKKPARKRVVVREQLQAPTLDGRSGCRSEKINVDPPRPIVT